MKVLVGIDDSAHAETALEFVRQMTWPPDTTVVIVSAVQLPLGAYSEIYTPVAADMGARLEEVTKMRRDMTSCGARKLADAGLRAQERVLQGDPRLVLIEEASRERADLIVVGSHGRTGLEKLMMRSVAT